MDLGTSSKMILISHRGNLNGPNIAFENNLDYITEAINSGFDCEIDLWKIKEKIYLGHDEPQYIINNINFLNNKKLWVHCKNNESLEFCLKNNFHCFFHNNDNYTITSKGYIWAYPGKEFNSNLCISVLPELNNFFILKNCYGICSDYIIKIKENLNA
jgi:hypothetical protein